MLQHQQGLLRRSNEQLALKSAVAADLNSLCTELKDEVAAVRAKVAPLEEVRPLKGKVSLLEEEERKLRENLLAVTGEWDESRCQATEASTRADSLAKDLEAERSEAQGLKAQMGSTRCYLLLVYLVFLPALALAEFLCSFVALVAWIAFPFPSLFL
jgi:chromosome segregation ATPase